MRYRRSQRPAFHSVAKKAPADPLRIIRFAGSYAALPKGRAFIAVENLIDDARRENAFRLLMSLNMLIEFGDAFDFSGADFWQW